MATFDEMDKAADDAAKELEKLDPEAVKAVANWWSKWYHVAGHKRLGRKLLAKASSQFVEELAKLVKV
jgi:hypothetical protein